MADLALVVKGASLALSVAKYTGIIEDQLKLEVEQLSGSELEAGLRALQQAAESEREQRFLLREARGSFNKAISLEEGFRLGAAHLGLALCHAGLGDAVNAEKAISRLVQVQPPDPSMLLKAGRIANKASWLDVAAAGAVLMPLAPQLVLAKLAAPHAEEFLLQYEETVSKFEELQEEARLLLKQSLSAGCESVFSLTIPAAT
jgi:hypothetical protein